MDMSQTLHELGLEIGTIAAWPEPLSAKQLKPKYGKSPFPWKLLFSILMVLSAAGFFSYSSRSTGLGVLLFVAILGVCALSIPILKLLDRKVIRNIWVYPDQVLITHQSDRTCIKKSQLGRIYAYPVPSLSANAIEFVSQSGSSRVVGLPNTIMLSDLMSLLESNGYRIASRPLTTQSR